MARYRESRHDGADGKKAANARQLTQLVRTHLLSPGKPRKTRARRIHAVALDGSAMRTCGVFAQELGDVLGCTHVPERDTATATAQKRKLRAEGTQGPQVRVRNCTAAELLRDLPDSHVELAYLDFLGTITGDRVQRDSMPLDDIDLLLREKAAATLVLGLTFSARSPLEGFKSAEDKIRTGYLSPLFQHHQYAEVASFTRVYRRSRHHQSMVFLAFVLRKDTQIRGDHAQFVLRADGRFDGYS